MWIFCLKLFFEVLFFVAGHSAGFAEMCMALQAFVYSSFLYKIQDCVNYLCPSCPSPEPGLHLWCCHVLCGTDYSHYMWECLYKTCIGILLTLGLQSSIFQCYVALFYFDALVWSPIQPCQMDKLVDKHKLLYIAGFALTQVITQIRKSAVLFIDLHPVRL